MRRARCYPLMCRGQGHSQGTMKFSSVLLFTEALDYFRRQARHRLHIPAEHPRAARDVVAVLPAAVRANAA